MISENERFQKRDSGPNKATTHNQNASTNRRKFARKKISFKLLEQKPKTISET